MEITLIQSLPIEIAQSSFIKNKKLFFKKQAPFQPHVSKIVFLKNQPIKKTHYRKFANRHFTKVKASLWEQTSFKACTWKQKSCIGYKIYIDKGTNESTSIENRLLKSSPILKGFPSQPFNLKYTPINNSLASNLVFAFKLHNQISSKLHKFTTFIACLLDTNFFQSFFSEEDYFRSSIVE